MAIDRERLLHKYAPRLARQAAMPMELLEPDEPDDQVDQVEEPEEVSEPEHTGVMLAFYLDPQTATAIALPECDCQDPTCEQPYDVEDADELHLTLAYLGTAGEDVTAEQLPTLIDVATTWAAGLAPVTGTISGIGLFNNEDSIVTYASVDSPRLPSAREALVAALSDAGFTPSAEHGFTPHITLAYGDARHTTLPKLPVTFQAVTVAFAGQQTVIPLGVEAQQARQTGRAHTSPRAPQDVTSSLPTASVTWNPIVTNVGNHLYITAPATTERAAMWGSAPNPNPYMLWMQGRFVGAEKPNRNNALWSIQDLEMGKPTVAHGPLNWLHEDRHVIGTIADAQMIPSANRQAAALADAVPEAHITALSAVWRWLYPDEAAVIEMASEANQLAYSMECISEAVACAGETGCGSSYSYAEFSAGKTCEHLQDRAGVRRLVNPTFLGGAVIVPPTRPGWANADAGVLRQAAAMAEKAYDQAGRPDIPSSTWEQMMAGVIQYTHTR